MHLASLLAWPTMMGVIAGSISTWVYWLVSPQEDLARLSRCAKATQDEIRRFDGSDVRVVIALAVKALGLSLKQLGFIIGPAVLAIVPVLAIAWFMNRTAASELSASWIGSGFWITLCVWTILLRLYFKIK